ncbi:MAG TPA: ATP-binding protein [Candidatus Saccharimonadia bacterium]|nr:ATP-binding protein [Candidatus Saccharimonadia bacterium]
MPRNESSVLYSIVLIAAFSVATLFFLAFHRSGPQIPVHVFDFHFNVYGLLSLIGVFCNASLLWYVNLPKLRTPEVPWFSLYLSMNVIWGIGEAATRFSATAPGAVFWWQVGSIGLGFAPAAFFLFAVAYAYQDSFVSRVTPVVAMVVLGLLVEYLFLATGVNVDKNPLHATLTPWGFYPGYPSTYYPILIWLLGGYTGAQILLIQHFRKTKDWSKVKLFIYASLLPLIVGMTTDGILPKLGVIFPPSAVVTTALFATIVASVMSRYGLLRLNVRMFAPNLLQSMGESVIVTDPNLTIEYFNISAKTLLSVPLSDNKNLLDLFPKDQIEPLRQSVIEPLRRANFSQHEDMQVCGRAGEPIPVSVTGAKVLDAQNRLTGYSFVLADLRKIKAAEYQLQLEKQSVERQVTERTRQLNEVTARLEASLGSLPFGFAIITTKDHIAYHNQSLTRLLHLSSPDSSLQPISVAVLKQMTAEFSGAFDMMQCIRDCETSQQTIERSVMFGPAFFRFIFVPIQSSDASAKTTGTVMILEDVTEAKVLERSKDEFFSIASHELRTPLTAIRGNAALLLNYYKDIFKDPALHSIVDDINTSGARLIEIVNDFLDTSRLEQGKLTFNIQEFSLDKVLEQVIYEMGTVLREKNLYCKVDEHIMRLDSLPSVFADPDRAKQILYNLIGNAAKFTETGGISVGVELMEDHLKVLVTDTGRGIPVKNQQLLFRKFQQAGDSLLTRDSTRGTGLGLYISKLLAEGMQGSIGLESSALHKGSTFFFTLPMASSKKQKSTNRKALEGKSSRPLTHKRLVVVENDPYVQKLYARLFMHDTWQTEVVGPKEGISALTSAKPDLILLDIANSGTQHLADLRKTKDLAGVPIVALIKKDEPGTATELTKLGVKQYFVKDDLSMDALHAEIKQLLRGLGTSKSGRARVGPMG